MPTLSVKYCHKASSLVVLYPPPIRGDTELKHDEHEIQ